ncbi:MAG: class I SAM-dependent methyltransferase [Candidatus Contendobacter sp.]|nr:class I SAM-dependent methyltransferase [Candidatus Contendobacter sp.]MDG4557760.1 class I SAM-dependent methyltransferase [Candidatus Contendobacter sp.]
MTSTVPYPTAPFRIAVSRESPIDPGTAIALATTLGLPWVFDPLTNDFTHLLVMTAERLELRELGSNPSGPVYADFATGAVAHRRRFGGGRNQPLARAVGLQRGATPTVVDATAGLGGDAFVLACLGCVVRLVERSSLVAVLLRDGLDRAARIPDLGPLVAERLSLIVADGRNYLRALANDQRPDVVYLDPMYPLRRKAALAGKAMRLLRRLVGDDADAPELLATALASARRRVVVKRPRRAPPLVGPRPSFQIAAPNTRFDVYSLLQAVDAS